MDDPRELQLRNPHSYLHCLDPGTVVAQRERQPPQELHLWNQTVFSGGHSPSSELLELVVARSQRRCAHDAISRWAEDVEN